MTALALLAATTGGCAAIAGLDDFSKGGCSGGNCDAAADVTVGQPETGQRDTGMPDTGHAEASHRDAVPDHASTVDAVVDARPDVPNLTVDGALKDGGPNRLHDGGKTEAGCGPVDTTANCTACGLACDTTQSLGSTCNGTTCLYTGCVTGFANCNTAAPNTGGCDTPTNTVNNCSACGVTCDATKSLGATCSGTTCVYTGCVPGWADCVTTSPDSNGCDTQTNTVMNCGGCGAACDTTESTGATCTGTTCKYTGCSPGFADCNASTAPDTDGCETRTNTVTNCSACGDACDTIHSAGAACTGTTCTYTACSAGFANCETTAPDTNGCETPTNTVSNCAACGQACDTLHSVGATCSGTTCEYTGCAAGYADCDTSGADTNGCETFVGGSANSCGACGQTCDTTNSLGASCVAGTCVYTGCKAGFADCSTTPPDTNGCETPTDTTSNCGACGAACDTTRSVGAACTGTTCTYTGCDPGFADCATAAPDTNGCETSLSTTSNCTGCGDVCTAADATKTTCNGTTCQYACQPGFADCTAASAPDLGGCATATTTTSNCGGCGNVCTPLGATADSCNGLSCSYTCKTGYQDCNQDNAPDVDGCECKTPGCCGSACNTTHVNGTGEDFYDCNPPSTYTTLTAQAACNAYAATLNQAGYDCGDGWNCDGNLPPTVVCYQKSDLSSCPGPCWGYSAQLMQGVLLQGDVMACACPFAATGATWN